MCMLHGSPNSLFDAVNVHALLPTQASATVAATPLASQPLARVNPTVQFPTGSPNEANSTAYHATHHHRPVADDDFFAQHHVQPARSMTHRAHAHQARPSLVPRLPFTGDDLDVPGQARAIFKLQKLPRKAKSRTKRPPMAALTCMVLPSLHAKAMAPTSAVLPAFHSSTTFPPSLSPPAGHSELGEAGGTPGGVGVGSGPCPHTHAAPTVPREVRTVACAEERLPQIDALRAWIHTRGRKTMRSQPRLVVSCWIPARCLKYHSEMEPNMMWFQLGTPRLGGGWEGDAPGA